MAGIKNGLFVISLLFFTILADAQQVVTTSAINLRSAPTIESKVLYHIPKGTAILLNGCESDWCEISVSGHSGFIAKQYTASPDELPSRHQTVAHATGPVNYYTNSRGNVVQSPTRYDAPPEGATAKCRDGSYSFSQSRRGTCSHHGGVARWLQ